MIRGKPKSLEIVAGQRRCWCHYPDLSYDDFGRGGLLSHWKIASMFESARYMASRTEVLKLDPAPTGQYTNFTLGIDYKINPELWTAPQDAVFPYKISVEMSDLGQTSVTVYSEMVNKLNNHTVASALCKYVHVDWATRRPAPFPDWYFQTFAPISVRQKRPLILRRAVPEMPVTAHCYNVEVAASDTDINVHTNQASYVRFCCDAAQSAVRAGALSGFQQDIARYPLIEHQTVYSGECDMGDRLQVFVWQPPDRTDQILFVIKRKDAGSQSALIFQADMVFQMKQLELPHLARL